MSLLSLIISLVPALTAILGLLIPVLGFVADFTSGMNTTFAAFFDLLQGKTGIEEFMAKVQSIGGPFGQFRGWLDELAIKIRTFFLGAQKNFTSVGKGISGFFRGVGSTISGVFGNAVSGAKSMLNQVIDAVNRAIGGINGIGSAVGGAVGISVNIPKIPRLAKGGIAMPSRGGTYANIAEAGVPEAVIPLSKNSLAKYGIGGGGGVQVTIQMSKSFVGTKGELAQTIRQILVDGQRSGAIPVTI